VASEAGKDDLAGNFIKVCDIRRVCPVGVAEPSSGVDNKVQQPEMINKK